MSKDTYWYELSLGERTARRLAKLTGVSADSTSDDGFNVENTVVKRCFMLGLRELESQRDVPVARAKR